MSQKSQLKSLPDQLNEEITSELPVQLEDALLPVYLRYISDMNQRKISKAINNSIPSEKHRQCEEIFQSTLDNFSIPYKRCENYNVWHFTVGETENFRIILHTSKRNNGHLLKTFGVHFGEPLFYPDEFYHTEQIPVILLAHFEQAKVKIIPSLFITDERRFLPLVSVGNTLHVSSNFTSEASSLTNQPRLKPEIREKPFHGNENAG